MEPAEKQRLALKSDGLKGTIQYEKPVTTGHLNYEDSSKLSEVKNEKKTKMASKRAQFAPAQKPDKVGGKVCLKWAEKLGSKSRSRI